MATKEVTICDVFGTTAHVAKYRIAHGPVDEDGDIIVPAVINVDLSPRAFIRLIRKIEQGTTPPAKRKKE